MMSYKQQERAATSAYVNSSPSGTLRQSSSPSALASANITHGYSRLRSLNVTVRRSSSLTHVQTSTPSPRSASPLPAQTPPHIQPHQETIEEAETRKVWEVAEDRTHVERELSRYKAAGISTSFENTGMVNIDEFWSVSVVFTCSYFIFTKVSYRRMNTNILTYFEWQWTSFRLKHLQCHASESFHPAKKPVLSAIIVYPVGYSKPFKFSSSPINLNDSVS